MNANILTKRTPPKVALVLPHSCEPFFPGFFASGGTGEQFHCDFFPAHDSYYNNLARSLIGRGFEPVVYYLAYMGHRQKEYRHRLGHRLVPVQAVGRPGKWGWEYSLDLIRKLRQDSPDLIHIFGYCTNGFVPDMPDVIGYYCGVSRVPYVLHATGRLPARLRLVRQWVKDRTVRFAALVAVANEADRTKLCWEGANRNVIKLENIVNLELFYTRDRLQSLKALGFEDRYQYIVGVGRQVRAKGFQDVIQVLPRLDSNIHFVLVGDGPDRDYFAQLAGSLGVAERVRAVGWVPTQVLPLYYSMAHACVLPSRTEGLPVTALESLSCNTPVIAGSVGGLIDIVKDGTGLLYDPGDLDALRDIIINVVSGLVKFNSDSMSSLVSGYSMASVGEKLSNCYNQILAKSRQRKAHSLCE